jgi:hypothetical protein
MFIHAGKDIRCVIVCVLLSVTPRNRDIICDTIIVKIVKDRLEFYGSKMLTRLNPSWH